jgi:P-type Cu+ transporter
LPASKTDEKTLIQLAASLERASEHPLAGAVVRSAEMRNIELRPITNFRSVTGGGVTGIIDGRHVAVGKAAFLASEGVPLEAVPDQRATALQADGKTVLLVAIDGQMSGLMAVADPIKDSSREAIGLLNRLGVKLMMVSGDNRLTAGSVARQLGIGHFEAEIGPDGKVEIINKQKMKGEYIAMAGDGINDAPALAAADVGIAMGAGSDVAMESAGVTLVSGDLRGIAKAIKLSRASMVNIRQNLFFAFAYNVIGIPIAAGALYPFFGVILSPMIAGAAMSLSSVSVVMNSLRLRRVRL